MSYDPAAMGCGLASRNLHAFVLWPILVNVLNDRMRLF
jgi:hypothetical protein